MTVLTVDAMELMSSQTVFSVRIDFPLPSFLCFKYQNFQQHSTFHKMLKSFTKRFSENVNVFHMIATYSMGTASFSSPGFSNDNV